MDTVLTLQEMAFQTVAVALGEEGLYETFIGIGCDGDKLRIFLDSQTPEMQERIVLELLRNPKTYVTCADSSFLEELIARTTTATASAALDNLFDLIPTPARTLTAPFIRTAALLYLRSKNSDIKEEFIDGLEQFNHASANGFRLLIRRLKKSIGRKASSGEEPDYSGTFDYIPGEKYELSTRELVRRIILKLDAPDVVPEGGAAAGDD
jgi:hypothetical protein